MDVTDLKPYERVQYLRKRELKISQEIFANKINLSRSNLGNIETNKVKLTDRVINDICETYSVNKEWILTGKEPIYLEGDDPFISQIVELYKMLNDDNRKYLKGYVYRLLEEQTALAEKNKSISIMSSTSLQAEEAETDPEVEEEVKEYRNYLLDEKRQAQQTFSAK